MWLEILANSPQPSVWTNAKGETKAWPKEWVWPIPTTFLFDASVEAATEAWQVTRGLRPDGVVGPITWKAAGVPAPPLTHSLVKGTDTSIFQGKLPARAMREEGHVFNWSRCKVGNHPGRDTVFAENVKSLRDVNIIPGAYFFPFPLPHLNALDQADLFAEAAYVDGHILGEDQGELPPAFDLEWPPPEDWDKWKCNPEQIVDWSLICLKRIETTFRCKPVIYSYPFFLQSIMRASNYAKLMRYKLWIAGGPQYLNGNGKWPDIAKEKPPQVPGWGSDWLFWQWDGNGGRRLPGTNVDSDFVVYRYDHESLDRLCQVQVPDQEPDTLPDLNVILQASTRLIMEDATHQYRQERAMGIVQNPV